jgi:hypothetical protein
MPPATLLFFKYVSCFFARPDVVDLQAHEILLGILSNFVEF